MRLPGEPSSMMYLGAVVHDGPFPRSRSGRTLEFMGPIEEFLNFCSSSSKGLPIRGDKEVRLDKLDCSEETPLRRAMPGGAGRVFQKRPTWIAHFSPLVGYALHKGCLDGVQATFLFIVLRTFCFCGTSSLYWICGTFPQRGLSARCPYGQWSGPLLGTDTSVRSIERSRRLSQM